MQCSTQSYTMQHRYGSTLNHKLKSKLLSCSSLIVGDDFAMFSFMELHMMFARATPTQWSNYVLSNQMYAIINSCKPDSLWISLQNNISINNRTDIFTLPKQNKENWIEPICKQTCSC